MFDEGYAKTPALDVQPKVVRLLTHATEQHQLSHNYLFASNDMAGVPEVIELVARLLLCPYDGCTTCEECVRIARMTHPDICTYQPESAKGYVIAQALDMLKQAARSPIRARAKLIVIYHAELLREQSANALLKTLEEPNEHTYFILVTKDTASVLSTIVSRCHVVPFDRVSANDAIAYLMNTTSCNEKTATRAYLAASTLHEAQMFAKNKTCISILQETSELIRHIDEKNTWEIIEAADRIGYLIEQNQKLIQEELDTQSEREKDFLSAQAKKQHALANKRRLMLQQTSMVNALCSLVEHKLEDILVCSTHITSQGNFEPEQTWQTNGARTKTCSPQAIADALRKTRHARRYAQAHVSSTTTCEFLFLAIKETLYAHRCAR